MKAIELFHSIPPQANRRSLQKTHPWEAPFWKPAKSKTGILLYLILIHTLALVGVILFPLPSVFVAILFILLACLGGLGTTVGYHRLLAHRALKANKPIEQFLIFWAVFNGSGHPASWVAYHRQHHSRSDTSEDISSPQYGGFWWAHLRWLYQSAPADSRKWCPDLSRNTYRLWKFAQAPVVLLSLCCGLALGWQGFFWVGAIRLVYSLHMQCFVNSFSHMGDSQDGNSSKNIWWLGPWQLTAWGENWHRNHHSSVRAARFGWHWWQIDIGWYFIRMLEFVGLASNIKYREELATHEIR